MVWLACDKYILNDDELIVKFFIYTTNFLCRNQSTRFCVHFLKLSFCYMVGNFCHDDLVNLKVRLKKLKQKYITL